MSDEISSKDYIDRSMDAVRAQNDARFSEVLSEVRSLREDLKRVPSLWQVWGAVITGFGAVLAVLAFGGDRFDGGIAAYGVVREAQEAQEARDQAQDQRTQETLDRIDAFIASQTSAPQE